MPRGAHHARHGLALVVDLGDQPRRMPIGDADEEHEVASSPQRLSPSSRLAIIALACACIRERARSSLAYTPSEQGNNKIGYCKAHCRFMRTTKAITSTEYSTLVRRLQRRRGCLRNSLNPPPPPAIPAGLLRTLSPARAASIVARTGSPSRLISAELAQGRTSWRCSSAHLLRLGLRSGVRYSLLLPSL